VLYTATLSPVMGITPNGFDGMDVSQ
jgi:hypothetical protein